MFCYVLVQVLCSVQNLSATCIIYAGLSELETKVKGDQEDTRTIQELWTSKPNDKSQPIFEVHYFDEASDLMSIADSFRIMCQEKGGDVFSKLWRKNLREASDQASGKLTFHELIVKAWKPSFQECENLRKQLEDHTVSMIVVNEHFGHYDKPTIVLLLKALAVTIDRCHSKPMTPQAAEEWARHIADLMLTHWKFRRYGRAATLFLDLKKQLELTGNFQAMERLQAVVSFFLTTKVLLFQVLCLWFCS